MYPSFNWWTGIIEDRADPQMLGRCRVRIIGYHTEDKTELPTIDLPWAIPAMPLTSASISGIGETPSFVEGTSVLGFFSDGDEGQIPVIMGTLPGKPRNKRDKESGFSDPFGKYPRSDTGTGLNGLQESDLSRLARNAVAEGHASLQNKRESRVGEPPETGPSDKFQDKVPRAVAPHVDSVSADIPGAVYDRELWEEPHPRFGESSYAYNAPNQQPDFSKKTSVYPFNKVVETESGHVFEVDDTPNNGRIHEYHNSGTFYEIQADGSKITKVVGDEYEITLNDKKVYIKGSCDVTIGGDARMLVTGDMYQEIGGNLFTTVAGNRVTKIIGNDLIEVVSGQNSSIARDQALRVGGSKTDLVIGDSTQTVAGDKYSTVGGNITSISVGSTSHTSILGFKIMSTGVPPLGILGNVSVSAPTGSFKAMSLNMSLSAALNQTVTAATQLIEGTTNQTLSGVVTQSIVSPVQLIVAATSQTTTTPLQSISAATRTITAATTHTGVYNITGALNVTGLVTSGSIVSGAISGTAITQGTINLGTHMHPTAPTGPVSSPSPLP